MNEQRMRFLIGLVMVGALGALCWLVILFGSVPTFFKSSNQYVVHFKDAQGVGPGSPIRRSGVRIGEVRDVILDDDQSDVRVVLAIDRRFTMRRNDEAMVVTGLLGGDAGIDIVSRPVDEEFAPEDRKPVPPGGEIKGVVQPTVGSVLKDASGVAPAAQEALNEIRKSVQRVEKSIPVFEATLNEYKELARDLRKATPSLNQASDEMRDLVRDARKAVPTLTRTAEDIQALSATVRDAVPDARKTLKEFTTLSEDARKAMPNLTKTSDEIRGLAQDARKAVPSFTRTIDEIRELVRDIRGVPAEKPQPREAPREMLNQRDGSRDVIHQKAPPKEAQPPVAPPNRPGGTLPPAALEPRGLPAEARKVMEEAAVTLRTWNRVGERLDVLIQGNQDRVVKALETLIEVLMRVSGVFNETNQNNIAEILRNVRAASTNFDSISRNVDVITTEGRTSVRRLNSTLERSDALIKDLQGTSKDLQGVLKAFPQERVATITKNLDDALVKMNDVLSDVRVMVKTIGQSDGTVSRLLTDPSLYNKIDEAACNLPRITARIERILKDFEIFADKLARHPELLGVGGAVRGSSGVKDSPLPAHNTSFYPPGPPGPPGPVPPR